MGETVTKRLHIGGITPSITADHLRDRFRSFGTVQEVEEMGIDALGQHRPFAFLTIETTPAQLRKCLNIMSGAMWRGAQLRLAEAKPRYDAKLVADRNAPAGDAARRTSRRLRRAVVLNGGCKEAQDMSLVTTKNFTHRTFWVNDNGHLIRPMSMRPTHPIPAPLDAVRNSSARPPVRAHRRVIDPRRWAREHLILNGEVTPASEVPEWEFEDADEAEDADEEGRVLLGWWRRGDEETAVWARRPRVDDEEDAYEFEFGSEAGQSDSSDLFPAREGSPLFPTRADSPLFPARADSPLFPVREGAEAEDSSPLFPVRKELPEESASDSDVAASAESPLFPVRKELEEESDDADASVPSKSPSPSPVSTAPVAAAASLKRARAAEDSDSDDTAPVVPAVPEKIRAIGAAERSGALNVISSLLDVKADKAPAPVVKHSWTGYAESDSDDDLDYSALKPQTAADDDDFEVVVARASAPSPEVAPAYARSRSSVQQTMDFDKFPTAKHVGVNLPDMDSDSDSDDGDDSFMRGRPQVGGGPIPDESEDSGSDSDSDSDSDSSSSSGSSSSGSSDSSDSEEESKKENDKAKNDKKEESSDDSSDDSSSGSGSDSDSDSSDSDSDSSDSDSSDSGSEESDDEDIKQSGPAAAVPGKLKAMFAPAAAKTSSFSLMGTLAPDLEIDETIDVPLPTSKNAPELEVLAAVQRSTFDPDTNIPLFFPLPVRPVKRGEARSLLAPEPEPEADGEGEGHDEGYGGDQQGGHDAYGAASNPYENANSYDVGSAGPSRWGGAAAPGRWGQDTRTAQPVAAAPVATKKRAGFYEAETDEDMKKRWEARRLELTQGWKRKHREAVKHRRRRGGQDAE